MVVVIDEVQKIPQILNEIHWMIENIKGVSCILCGLEANIRKREPFYQVFRYTCLKPH